MNQPQLIQTRYQDAVGTIAFNHGTKRNALNQAMLAEILAALSAFEVAGARAIIIRTHQKEAVWSAGHDIQELGKYHRDPLDPDTLFERTLRAIRAFPAPVIAMVHGSVWGGAFDLAISCDILIADETATFAMTPVNLGLPYNTSGLLHFLGRIPMNLVRELFFTAAPLSSEDALRWGIVNHRVSQVDLEPFTYRMARTIAAKAPLAIRAIKEQLRIFADEFPISAHTMHRIQELRRQAYESADYKEGLAAFLEKRPPVFQGT